ncbi:MAG: hypothetical protein ACO2Z6_07870, partial [Pseudohongiellaceae bacterium]
RNMHYNSAYIKATHHKKTVNYTDMGHKWPQGAHRALMRRRVGKKQKLARPLHNPTCGKYIDAVRRL